MGAATRHDAVPPPQDRPSPRGKTWVPLPPSSPDCATCPPPHTPPPGPAASAPASRPPWAAGKMRARRRGARPGSQGLASSQRPPSRACGRLRCLPGNLLGTLGLTSPTRAPFSDFHAPHSQRPRDPGTPAPVAGPTQASPSLPDRQQRHRAIPPDPAASPAVRVAGDHVFGSATKAPAPGTRGAGVQPTRPLTAWHPRAGWISPKRLETGLADDDGSLDSCSVSAQSSPEGRPLADGTWVRRGSGRPATAREPPESKAEAPG